MSGTSDLPQAPPPAHYNKPPQFKNSNNTTTVLWVLVGVVVAIAVSGAVYIAIAVLAFSDHDRLELIDKSEFVNAIERPCEQLTSLAATMPSDPTPAQLTQLVGAGRAIPAALEPFTKKQLDDDYPTEDWGNDWTTLMNALETYVTALASDKNATFEMPETEDKFSIVGRMEWAIGDCPVPQVIQGLDATPPPVPTG